jgi:MipA family protein
MAYWRICIAALGMALALAGRASAQSAFALPPLPPIPGEWTVTVGAAAELAPAFEGSKRYVLSPQPKFAIRRVGTVRPFSSPRDNPGISLIDIGGFHIGPVGKLKAERNASDFAELRGLGDVMWTLELGIFAELWAFDWLRTRAEVRQGIGGHDGLVADLSADMVTRPFDRLTLSAGPRFSLADTRATAPFFGINSAQAAASGLPVFNARGGAHAVGMGAQVLYQLTPQWELNAFVEYDRLLGSAAASPLVVQRGSRDQLVVGFGATYSFDIKLW